MIYAVIYIYKSKYINMKTIYYILQKSPNLFFIADTYKHLYMKSHLLKKLIIILIHKRTHGHCYPYITTEHAMYVLYNNGSYKNIEVLYEIFMD